MKRFVPTATLAAVLGLAVFAGPALGNDGGGQGDNGNNGQASVSSSSGGGNSGEGQSQGQASQHDGGSDHQSQPASQPSQDNGQGPSGGADHKSTSGVKAAEHTVKAESHGGSAAASTCGGSDGNHQYQGQETGNHGGNGGNGNACPQSGVESAQHTVKSEHRQGKSESPVNGSVKTSSCGGSDGNHQYQGQETGNNGGSDNGNACPQGGVAGVQHGQESTGSGPDNDEKQCGESTDADHDFQGQEEGNNGGADDEQEGCAASSPSTAPVAQSTSSLPLSGSAALGTTAAPAALAPASTGTPSTSGTPATGGTAAVQTVGTPSPTGAPVAAATPSAGGVAGVQATLGSPNPSRPAGHGGVLGTIANVAGGSLPFTGLALWIAVLIAAALVVGGVAFRRHGRGTARM